MLQNLFCKVGHLNQWMLVDGGGLAMGWRTKRCKCENNWSFYLGLGLEVYAKELGITLTIVNIYEPYQDKVMYWESLIKKSFISGRR